MASKILSFSKKINEPLIRFIVINGWELRLASKRNKGLKFRVLSNKEKEDIKSFWKKYNKRVNPNWAAYYSYGTKLADCRYVPESLYYGEIMIKLGQQNLYGLNHKNVQEQIFSSKQPKTIVRKTDNIFTNANHEFISLEEAADMCHSQGKVIVKPASGTYGGSGIVIWSIKDGSEELNTILESNNNIIIQEIVESHPFLSEIHPSSLNTLRLVTLLTKDRVVLLSTILRMGRNKSVVDNFSAGGLIASVNQNGRLKESAVQSDQSIINKHPDGFIFKDKVVPYFDNVVNDAINQHYRVPYFKLVSWDYSIDKSGEPVLIEMNVPGQIDLHQLNNGPIFGDYTEAVLDHVYLNKEL